MFLQILKTLPYLTTESTADNGSLLPQNRDSSGPEAELLQPNDAKNSSESSSTETSQNADAFASRFYDLHTSQNSGSGHDPSEGKPRSSAEDSCAPPLQDSVSLPVARLLSEYLEDQPDEYFERYLLPKKFYRYFWLMDLTEKNSRNTCCFTKRSVGSFCHRT